MIYYGHPAQGDMKFKPVCIVVWRKSQTVFYFLCSHISRVCANDKIIIIVLAMCCLYLGGLDTVFM